MSATHKLSATDTALYGIAMGVGIRWIAVAAAAGPSSLPMWVLALVTFFVPLAAATVELTTRVEGEGGIYAWARDILGPFAGFICGWFYWISLIPYFATILVFLGGLTIAAIGGDPKDTALYLTVALATSALVTGVQLAGLRYGKWLPNIGTAGGWIVVLAIVTMSVMIGVRRESATSFGEASYVPPMNSDTAILWATMVFGFCGVEAIAFLRNEIAGGMRTIARVLLVVGISATIIFVVGTAALLVILPQNELSRLAGFADALRAGLGHVGLGGAAPTVVALFALSMLGGFTAWFGVGARLPFAAGVDAYLPAAFARRHPRTGAPVAAILLQAALMVAMIVLGQAGTSVANAYDFLMSMSVLTVTIPYAIMFVVYLRASRLPPTPGAWTPPGGVRTSVVLAWTGLLSTLVAIACSLVPSPTEEHKLTVFLKIVVSSVVMFGVAVVAYRAAAKRRRTDSLPASAAATP